MDRERIADELEKIGRRLAAYHPTEQTQLYVAQQALAWVLDADLVASPYCLVTNTSEGSEGCSARSSPSRS